MIQVNRLTGGYGHQKIVHNLSFSVRKGELFGILGPNGSGKTTVMKMVSGIMPIQGGEVLLKGKNLQDYTSKELARVVAVLPQMTSQHFSYTVKETVSLGRYAHQSGWFPTWKEEDERAVLQALQQTGTGGFANARLDELSGGERQRVFLAQALAQEPEILLLDEPTNHLDLSYQKDLLDLLKKMARDHHLTIISIFHDLNLASLYCDRLLLIEQGKIHRMGKPNRVLKREAIHAVYQTDIDQRPHPKVPKPQLSITPKPAEKEQSEAKIGEAYIRQNEKFIALESPVLLKTLSSGVTGAGWGWHRSFVNRHVSRDYNPADCKEDMEQFLSEHHFDPDETVGMMTAVQLQQAAFHLAEQEGVSVFSAVTAGAGNAVDISRAKEHQQAHFPGTINIWVFVNGYLTEEAFVQAIMTATEAKVKALLDKKVKDPLTGSQATGTSTDSIVIAATQQGAQQDFAGPITPAGQAIGEAVYESTIQALEKNLSERSLL
ncbi:adenosylcobinamide amidohydrolase [Bacillus xiapuensis]|uniref:adenosylcobinamide amidohydrolase n=1 Tax=Bacillus xiapuensis TaxID=2014075 RepID=UPI000C246665|nr:adenosylcobinamide amidohydrolase [Bacillus xiapuensis]